MTIARAVAAASTLALFLLTTPAAVAAGVVTANCTGMMDLKVYTFDTTKKTQKVNDIGDADFSMSDNSIFLTGEFGEYRFDLKVGTLYHNDKDTGLYCTYSGLDR